MPSPQGHGERDCGRKKQEGQPKEAARHDRCGWGMLLLHLFRQKTCGRLHQFQFQFAHFHVFRVGQNDGTHRVALCDDGSDDPRGKRPHAIVVFIQHRLRSRLARLGNSRERRPSITCSTMEGTACPPIAFRSPATATTASRSVMMATWPVVSKRESAYSWAKSPSSPMGEYFLRITSPSRS